jgi:hypothetical protein
MSKYCGTCGDGYLDISEEIKAAKLLAKKQADEHQKPFAVYKEKHTGLFKVCAAAEALAERLFVFEVIR